MPIAADRLPGSIVVDKAKAEEKRRERWARQIASEAFKRR
jgi:hypothetical protein